jgi:hypothetical protein
VLAAIPNGPDAPLWHLQESDRPVVKALVDFFWDNAMFILEFLPDPSRDDTPHKQLQQRAIVNTIAICQSDIQGETLALGT